jgi:AcrR family transcriptional regulator
MVVMTRRSDALSRERIIEASIEILDKEGEGGLTVRAVTAHLATGRGAIYHHVAGKDDLLEEAADGVMSRVAGDDLRALALGVFDAIDAHPWVGAQLNREPLQPAVLRIWKGFGTHLHARGLTGRALTDAGSALVSYVLGAAAQHAAGARRAPDATARRAYLDRVAGEWAEAGPGPLGAEVAAAIREHDDRAQFLAGLDIFLRGAVPPE